VHCDLSNNSHGVGLSARAYTNHPDLKKRKDSAGSDDAASMIKGGGYIGARTRQPHPLVLIRACLVLLLSRGGLQGGLQGWPTA